LIFSRAGQEAQLASHPRTYSIPTQSVVNVWMKARRGTLLRWNLQYGIWYPYGAGASASTAF